MNFLVNPPVVLHRCSQHFRSGGRKFGEEHRLKLVSNGRSESTQGSSRETYVWTQAKNLASLRSVGWQASCSSNSRLKSGGGKIPSLHAEGKFCNIYLTARNLERLRFGESLQNDPLKRVKSFTLHALVSQPLHSPLLYEIFGEMVNNTLVSKT